MLQDRESELDPVQGFPPFEAAVICGRIRVWAPLPQVLEQPPKAPQLPQAQFTGQDFKVQARFSMLDPQARPPFKGRVTMYRVLACVPVPQDVEHDCQFVQALMAQFLGNGGGGGGDGDGDRDCDLFLSRASSRACGGVCSWTSPSEVTATWTALA